MSKSLKQFLSSALDKGGVLAVGVGCLVLCKKKYIPKVFGPVSYGIISLGTIGIARHFIMFIQSKKDADLEQEPENVLEAIAQKRKADIQEMRKVENIGKLRKTMSDKEKESDAEKQQKDQPGTLGEEQRKPEQEKPGGINIIEHYFSDNGDCLKNSNVGDEFETVEIPPVEEFEMVPKDVQETND